MKLDQHYVDPRLVALYDGNNPGAEDTEFYLQLAADLEASCILDLGCGTGVLTRKLAAVAGRQVSGVDPAPSMLAHARQQPGAERVRWVEGNSSALGTPGADLAVMTGNVAQVFLDDAEWNGTLRHLHAALRPGGHLAFDSRRPEARAWEGWTRAATHERGDSIHGPLESWLEVVDVQPGRVHFVGHNVFLQTGENVVVDSELRFHSQREIADSLEEVGFTITDVYGDWQRGPVTSESRVMVFVAGRGG
ncbi:class I SAM-dependent methyltransferase [Deinococcus frigens]|uniref:class I SAM-dependent methyltransferase n=1 Tax=Deinococcus frigens TaxID=249403 RepID=UPI0004952E09|nr:class I SAM-dependent methyltransferase [Deinococcus frigens]